MVVHMLVRYSIQSKGLSFSNQGELFWAVETDVGSPSKTGANDCHFLLVQHTLIMTCKIVCEKEIHDSFIGWENN